MLKKAMTVTLEIAELQNINTSIESAIKHAPNSLQAAAVLLPTAAKIQQAIEKAGEEQQPEAITSVPAAGPPSNRAQRRAAKKKRERFPVPE